MTDRERMYIELDKNEESNVDFMDDFGQGFVIGFEKGWEAARQWIPVEDQPKEYGPYLIYDPEQDFIMAADYENGIWTDREEGLNIIPSHWQPLPEPPQ